MCKVSTGNDEGAVRIFELGKKPQKCQPFTMTRVSEARIPSSSRNPQKKYNPDICNAPKTKLFRVIGQNVLMANPIL